MTEPKRERVLVTGGAGYVGHVLVPRLIAEGYDVVLYDSMLFGNRIGTQPHLLTFDADIRDTATFEKAVAGCDTVIHMACISNDPSFELDEKLSTSINYDCFEPLVVAAKKAGVKRFIYASSSSVYGVSDAPEVTEDHPLVPLTLYNKYKGMCEPLLWKHQAPGFTCVTIRPATLCGYSPRCRLDLTVNILTNHAVNNGKITVFGGAQKRPNLHIDDMVDAYLAVLRAPAEKIAGETFNIGYENHTVMDIAQMVKRMVEKEMPERAPIAIERTETNDNRSYHINSDKITRVLGFKPKRNIEDAVRDLCRAFAAGKLPGSMDDPSYINVRTIKQRNAA
jgi:nucleoside-diphosphate-sugar epimerase